MDVTPVGRSSKSLRSPVDLMGVMNSHCKFFMPYVLWNSHGVTAEYPVEIASPANRASAKTWNPGQKPGKSHTAVANLIQKIDNDPGPKWAIVPRMREGVAYVSELDPNEAKYQIWSKTDPWASHAAIELQNVVGSHAALRNQYEFLADAAQGWDTGPWKTISLTTLPRWFWIQTNAQSSFGSIDGRNIDKPEKVAATAFAAPCLALTPNPKRVSLSPASNVSALKARLPARLSPTALEFLCIELLNLAPVTPLIGQLAWAHVGGPGDGNVDRIGFDTKGNPKAFLQVKWQIDPKISLSPVGVAGSSPMIVTYLIGKPPVGAAGVAYWNAQEIARLVLAYAPSLSTSFKNLLGV